MDKPNSFTINIVITCKLPQLSFPDLDVIILLAKFIRDETVALQPSNCYHNFGGWFLGGIYPDTHHSRIAGFWVLLPQVVTSAISKKPPKRMHCK